MRYDFDRDENPTRRRNYSLENVPRTYLMHNLVPKHKLIKSKRKKLMVILEPRQGDNRAMSPPAKKVIDRMLRNINEKIKRGAYDAFSTKKETKKHRKKDK